MAVIYTGTHACILNDVAAHLASGMAVQAFLGVADATAARALIVEIDGEPPLVRHLLLTQPRCRYQRTPGGAFRGPGMVQIHLCSPATAGDTSTEDFRRALNWYSPILAWCAEMQRPLLREIDDDEVVVTDASDGLPGWIVAAITLTLDVIP